MFLDNVSQVGTQKRSDQLLAEQVGQSRNQIQRYIRLTDKTKSEKKVLAEAKDEAEAIRAAEAEKAEESDTETTVE